MGGCQNYGPCLGTLDRIIIGIKKGTIILTTTQMDRPVVVGRLPLGPVHSFREDWAAFY